MKNRSSVFLSLVHGCRAAAALAILVLVLPQARSAVLYWDSNGNTAGAGAAPSGTWGTSAFWSTSSAGTNATANTTTSLKDDLYFSAGTDATGTYTVTLDNLRSARVLILEEGNVTFSGGTLNLASSNGGITMNGTASNAATVSSNVTISGAQIFNIATGNTLTLDTGTFTRNAGAALNVQGAGTVSSTQAGLNTLQPTGLLGTWATIGSGSTTRYATLTGSTLTAYTGTTAATAANLTDTTGTLNYELTAATGSTPASVSANTIRYAGGSATLTTGGTLFSLNGLLTTGSGTLTIASNAVTIGADRELVINTVGSSGVVISSVIQDNAAGASGITKTGNRGLTLSGNNTYTGVTYISQGILTVSHNNGLGSTAGNTVINTNGSTSTGGILALSGNVTISEDITITGPGDGTSASYSPTLTSSSGNNTIAGVITLVGSNGYRVGAGSGTVLNLGLIQRTGSDSSSLIISASGTGVVNITQAIKNNGGGLTVHGGGTGILSASNNEIGGTIIQNNSTLKLAADNALPTNQSVQLGQSAIVNTATGANNDVATLFLEGVSQTINSLNGLPNAGTLPNNATPTDRRKITSSSANDSVLTVGFNNGGGNFDGVIEDGTGGGKISFVKAGTGTQTFLGTVANTYTGDTTVTGGTLVLAKTAGITSVAGNLNIGDGTGTDTVRLTNADQISDTSLVSFNGASAVLHLNGQNETVGGLSSASGAGVVQNESGVAGTSTLGIQVAAATSQSFGGTLRDGDGSGTDGTLAVVKSGTGTQILTGASTYTGGTTVNEGTLLAGNSTGSAIGSGPLLVATAGAFGGIGRVELAAASRATFQGTLSPGASAGSVGTLEFSLASAMGSSTSGLTFDSATLAFDLGAAGAGISATGTSDLLLLSGTVNEATDLSFTGSNVFDFGNTGEAGWYKLVDSSATSLIDWTGLTVDANRQITGGLGYANLGNGLTGSFYLGNGSGLGDYGDIYFQAVAVPEPGRMLLLGGGLLALLARRRRVRI